MNERSERELTGPFWAAVDRGELVRPVCADCGRSFFSPQVVCPHCQSSAWAYEPSSGRGQVYSHTTIHRPPDPSFVAPYVVADIELEEGWRMFSWIVNCDPTEVAIGMDVEVSFTAGPEGSVLPAFQPVPQALAKSGGGSL
jgi:uncharacterized OB-fold protein